MNMHLKWFNACAHDNIKRGLTSLAIEEIKSSKKIQKKLELILSYR